MQPPVSIPLALVYSRAEGRPVIKAHVATLADSLRALGLQSPITVRPCQQYRGGQLADAFEIVAGRHRFEAALLLKWENIDAFIMEAEADDAELWEIDENFARAELTDAQRADHHARRRRILVAKGIVHDEVGGRAKKGDNLSSYSDNAAAALGVDKRTVQRDLARGTKIAPEVLAVADDLTGQDLDELARTPRENQAAKAEEIRDRKDAATLNRYLDKQVARSNAEEAADIIHANLDLDQVDALTARLASVSMKDFLAALSKVRAA